MWIIDKYSKPKRCRLDATENLPQQSSADFAFAHYLGTNDTFFLKYIGLLRYESERRRHGCYVGPGGVWKSRGHKGRWCWCLNRSEWFITPLSKDCTYPSQLLADLLANNPFKSSRMMQWPNVQGNRGTSSSDNLYDWSFPGGTGVKAVGRSKCRRQPARTYPKDHKPYSKDNRGSWTCNNKK
jgi:hypothetical protein